MAGLLGWPFFYRHMRARGQGESFRPRLGLSPPPAPPAGSPRIWIHGVSVGEIMAAVPLVAELKALLPQSGLIISTGTETGQAVARRHFSPLGAVVCYFPVDLPWAVNRALRVLCPTIFVALESEVWPTFLHTAKARGIRLALVNARLSDRSWRRYTRFKKYLPDFIGLFEVIAAGSREDYQRFASLGLAPPKLCLTGNLKVDALLTRRETAPPGPPLPCPALHQGRCPARTPLATPAKQNLAFRESRYSWPPPLTPGRRRWCWPRDEALRGPYPALLLVLAPRHPERAAALGELLARRGHGYQLWSSLQAGSEARRQPVVLVNTVGDLFWLYGAADVAFVGGSLVPHGGQNILEPAVWGLSPYMGPTSRIFAGLKKFCRLPGWER